MSQIMLFSCPSYLIYNHGWRLSKSGIFEAMLVCNIMCSRGLLEEQVLALQANMCDCWMYNGACVLF